MNPLAPCRRRFAEGQTIASVVVNGERVSRFEKGYPVTPDQLGKLIADGVCWEDFLESDTCVRVFVATTAFKAKTVIQENRK